MIGSEEGDIFNIYDKEFNKTKNNKITKFNHPPKFYPISDLYYEILAKTDDIKISKSFSK